MEVHLNRKLARLASPYLGTLRRVTVGFALAFYNPLVMPERLVSRLVEEAWSCVHVQRAQHDLQNRCDLQEVLLADQLSTVFQPVVDLRTRRVLGYEALSRGPAGSVYQMPLRLFEMAAEADLVFELDRKCRRRAFASAVALPAPAKLFVNVFPSAMYDPEFQGAALVRLAEDQGLTPDRVVLEITEKSAIENYDLFAEALAELTRFGFSIAVDDVGAGYSGLEKIAHLNPRYLKFDRELIRNIDSSYIRREMTRALKAFADQIGSTIIAEGIEREGELRDAARARHRVRAGVPARPAGRGLPAPRPGRLRRRRRELRPGRTIAAVRPPAEPGFPASLALGVLVAIAVLAPWPFGAVLPGALLAVAVLALLAAALALGAGAWRGGVALPAVPLWPLAGFVAVGLLQLVPLPDALHALLAPGSHAVWRPAVPEAAAVLGSAARPVSVDPDSTLRGLALAGGLALLALLAAPALSRPEPRGARGRARGRRRVRALRLRDLRPGALRRAALRDDRGPDGAAPSAPS